MTNITCSNGHILIHTVTRSRFFVCSNLFFLLIHFNHFIWKVLIRWQPRRRRKAKRSNHTVLQRESNSIKILIINIYICSDVLMWCKRKVQTALFRYRRVNSVMSNKQQCHQMMIYLCTKYFPGNVQTYNHFLSILDYGDRMWIALTVSWFLDNLFPGQPLKWVTSNAPP